MVHADRLDTDIITFLKRHENKDLCRFVAVGSVDDGKSTLIGRLLHDTGGVYEDQIQDATRAGKGEIDFAMITDGLKAEREQGITIDVAYRYFTTPRRKFIIADTPGHIQYTRNMATGASTADVAIILIDARLGVLSQSRRHAYIASLLGIPNLLVAINKMDLRDYREKVYNEIRADFEQVVERLNFRNVTYFPISALLGDNIVEKSEKTPWFDGTTLLEYLETVDITHRLGAGNFRYPVQYVLRPNLNYRGFAGQIASGAVRTGDSVKVLPSGTISTVKAIDTYDGELQEAFAPQSVTIRLATEVDVSRGDIIVHADDEMTNSRRFSAMVVWMHEAPLDTSRQYLIKHATRYVRARVTQVRWKLDMETLDRIDTEALELNDIGLVELTTVRPIEFDPYDESRATGAIIVIDAMSNNTLAAGMIRGALSEDQRDTRVSNEERHARLGQRPATLWLTGGRDDTEELAYALERNLYDRGFVAHVLQEPEGGSLSGKGVRHLADGAHKCNDAGLISICVADATSSVHAARSIIGSGRFVDLYLPDGANIDLDSLLVDVVLDKITLT